MEKSNMSDENFQLRLHKIAESVRKTKIRSRFVERRV